MRISGCVCFSIFVPQTGESTSTPTAWFEVQVNGALVHSKKVSYIHVAVQFIPQHLTCHSWIVVSAAAIIKHSWSSFQDLCLKNIVLYLHALRVWFWQNGDGFVDNDQKMAKIVSAIEKALGKWRCTNAGGNSCECFCFRYGEEVKMEFWGVISSIKCQLGISSMWHF